jgi:hypothetical protein
MSEDQPAFRIGREEIGGELFAVELDFDEVVAFGPILLRAHGNEPLAIEAPDIGQHVDRAGVAVHRYRSLAARYLRKGKTVERPSHAQWARSAPTVVIE